MCSDPDSPSLQSPEGSRPCISWHLHRSCSIRGNPARGPCSCSVRVEALCRQRRQALGRGPCRIYRVAPGRPAREPTCCIPGRLIGVQAGTCRYMEGLNRAGRHASLRDMLRIQLSTSVVYKWSQLNHTSSSQMIDPAIKILWGYKYESRYLENCFRICTSTLLTV